MKPEYKFENGKLIAKFGAGVDADKDAVMSAEIALELKIDVLEAMTEIAKTDLPWLKEIIGKLG